MPDPTPTAKDPDVVVVDLGTKRRKQIKQLRRGKGKLMDKVKEALRELRASNTIPSNAQPVVIVVKEQKAAFDVMSMLGR
jgi:hypothetical protein